MSYNSWQLILIASSMLPLCRKRKEVKDQEGNQISVSEGIGIYVCARAHARTQKERAEEVYSLVMTH